MNPEAQPYQQQPQYDKPISQAAEQAAVPRVEGYTSNPFRATMAGLGTVFGRNPISSLTIVPMIALYAIIAAVASLLLVLVLHFAGKVGNILSILLAMVAFFYVFTVAVAAIIAILGASHEGQNISGRQALKAFSTRKLLTLFGAGIVCSVLITIGLILLVVPGLILIARLSLVPFVIYHEDAKLADALTRSWILSRGHAWELLGAHAAQLLVVGGSGGLLSVSGSYAGLAQRYHQLKAYEASNAPTGPTHYSNYVVVLVLLIALPLYLGGLLLFQTKFKDEVNKTQSCSSFDCSLKTTDVDTTPSTNSMTQ